MMGICHNWVSNNCIYFECIQNSKHKEISNENRLMKWIVKFLLYCKLTALWACRTQRESKPCVRSGRQAIYIINCLQNKKKKTSIIYKTTRNVIAWNEKNHFGTILPDGQVDRALETIKCCNFLIEQNRKNHRWRAKVKSNERWIVDASNVYRGDRR